MGILRTESVTVSPTELETDIQTAWEKAKAALPSSRLDPQAVAELVAALLDCARRAKDIGFLGGERELLRMAGYLDGRVSPSDFPRYTAC
jgi:hypothetical protein